MGSGGGTDKPVRGKAEEIARIVSTFPYEMSAEEVRVQLRRVQSMTASPIPKLLRRSLFVCFGSTSVR